MNTYNLYHIGSFCKTKIRGIQASSLGNELIGFKTRLDRFTALENQNWFNSQIQKLNRTLNRTEMLSSNLKSRTELQLEYFYFIIQLDCVKSEFY